MGNTICSHQNPAKKLTTLLQTRGNFRWVLDVYLKVKGNMKYLFAMMDDETRFWIAQEVADTKDTHDARHLFQMAREIAEKKPQILITDGLRSYRDAWLKEFRTKKMADSTVHIRHITLSGEHHNNKMERLNGEIRD